MSTKSCRKSAASLQRETNGGDDEVERILKQRRKYLYETFLETPSEHCLIALGQSRTKLKTKQSMKNIETKKYVKNYLSIGYWQRKKKTHTKKSLDRLKSVKIIPIGIRNDVLKVEKPE